MINFQHFTLLLKFNQISAPIFFSTSNMISFPFPEYSVPLRGAPLWLATPLVDERVHSWAHVYGSRGVRVCVGPWIKQPLSRESSGRGCARSPPRGRRKCTRSFFARGRRERGELVSFLFFSSFFFYFVFPFFGLQRGRGCTRSLGRARTPPFLLLVPVMPELARDARRASRKTVLIAVDLCLRKRR